MRKLIIVSLIFPFQLFAQQAELPKLNHSFIVIAHRGDHTKAPENSLIAYQNAIKEGVDFVEIDLRTTKDQQLVIMHDATTDRMTGISGKINQMTLADLRKLKIRDAKHPEWGSYSIPTFEEVLKLCKNKINIYLDFKDASAKAAYDLICKTGMQRQFIVYINSENQFLDWRKVAPKIPLMISLPQKVSTYEELKKVTQQYHPDILDGSYDDYNYETVAAAKKLEIPVWPDIQSENEANNWETALSLGFKGLQTDHPIALINFLKAHHLR
ncbi:MAG: glycerophosphodiester phosphodiesterase family protein [Bacteroidetes bacterium]|nr:glycerophosphodiester phosphodiesterase family protein [Bacteroidota bacterium]MBU1371813.1 glycerophosphodiester phosphodiesterase family protein [Bacteroidota bacterium]MBU1483302.1 glycerophosphodiester phosphodiesterase family protein [Bacteroidota bacterium]MBU1760274.1 glycerophosphodiester phosphodiesterase family protein [Bacteroidota bacterium]MBU2267272.1 glycerophosphodiester phosphodiesterase family protein [Bacteroidota bacterium]